MKADSALLSLRNVTAGYGGSTAIDAISLDVHAGEVVCLLGANGAGKTTTMAAITGLIKCTGEIMFAGQDLREASPAERVRRGVALSPEGRKVFPNLSVHENLLLGSFNPVARAARKQKLEEVYDLFPRLAERREQAAGLMSGGEQQMLAIGRALMACPKLLLLDEPSLGLAPKIVVSMFEAIEKVARSNVSILLVEQNALAAFSVASRGYVLSAGRIVHSDTVEKLRNMEVIQKAFLGDAAALSDHGPVRAADAKPMLSVRGLSRNFGGLKAIDDVSFDVAPGEYFGVIGPNGAGKTTLLNLMTGYLKPARGEILFEGVPIQGLPPYKVCHKRIGRTFQVVKPFAEMTVLDNVMVGALLSSSERVGIAEGRKIAQGPLEITDLWRKRDYLAGALTIGEKKKLELARSLATSPRLLLLDEVLAGLTRGEVDDLVAALRRINQSGVTIIMIEHLVHVIANLCQRVAVLNFGKLLFEGPTVDAMKNPDVVQAYLGRPIEAAS